MSDEIPELMTATPERRVDLSESLLRVGLIQRLAGDKLARLEDLTIKMEYIIIEAKDLIEAINKGEPE